MKKLFLLFAISAIAFSCKREGSDNSILAEEPTQSIDCEKVVNGNSVVNRWGVLSRTTCKVGPGNETDLVENGGKINPLFITSSNSQSKAVSKTAHFWFYGTSSLKLFKPVTYARVFVFDDNAAAVTKINAAKAQILAGNHYLGFDTGVFSGIYPLYVLNINHKLNSTGSISSSYNLESEIKKSLPTGSRIFIQFIVQSSPSSTLPTNFNTAKYAYCEFVNADDNAYPHFKIDYSDSNLGYQGNAFYYN